MLTTEFEIIFFAEFEIIRIPFLSDNTIILLRKRLSLYSHEHKQKYTFAVVYEAGIMARLVSITQAP